MNRKELEKEGWAIIIIDMCDMEYHQYSGLDPVLVALKEKGAPINGIFKLVPDTDNFEWLFLKAKYDAYTYAYRKLPDNLDL